MGAPPASRLVLTVVLSGAGLALGVFGRLLHLGPWLVARIVCAWIPAPGAQSPALNRLRLALPLHVAGYVVSAWWLRDLFLWWVVLTWLVLAPLSGLLALGGLRRPAARLIRIISGRRPAIILVPRYRWPNGVNRVLGLAGLTGALCLGFVLVRDQPIEFLRGGEPEMGAWSSARVAATFATDEQTLATVAAGLDELAAEWRAATATEAATPDDVRRWRLTFAGYRTTLVRLAWKYQGHADLAPAEDRNRALRLQTQAATAADEAASRFVGAFAGREAVIATLNEADERGAMAAGFYDRMRVHAERPSVHMITAAGGFYRADRTVALLLDETTIREPRHGRALMARPLVELMRSVLRPGDVILVRRNWYLANTVMPGYWTQAAIYTGTAEQLRAEELDKDLRVQSHASSLLMSDEHGDIPSIIEATVSGTGLSTVAEVIGGADAVAVLRPALTPLQRREVVARAFDALGKPYDFGGDFNDGKLLTSPELVARALAGFADLPPVERDGRKTLTPDDIVAFWASPEGGPLLAYVAYAEADEQARASRWSNPASLTTTVRRR